MIRRVLAILIGLVFLTAGALKAYNPESFALDVYHYDFSWLTWPRAVLLALYLPWLEILCGGALILGVGYRGALLITSPLVVVFIVAYASTRLRGLDIECGCFGHGFHRGAAWVLVGDPILLAGLLWLLYVELSGPAKSCHTKPR